MHRLPPMRLSALAVLVALTLATSPVSAREALVVFGAATRPDGTPSPPLLRRLEQAAKLAKSRPQALVVVSGGAVKGPAEGRVMARWLRQHGIAKARIVVEPRARHTGENADFVAPLLRGQGVHRVTLVTERYHARRARFHLRWALRALGGALGKVPVKSSPADDGLRGWARARRWLRETAKIVRDVPSRWRSWRRARARRRSAPSARLRSALRARR
jgi:uncharacterized SAM-binding protein YcdF (DUF218 family)